MCPVYFIVLKQRLTIKFVITDAPDVSITVSSDDVIEGSSLTLTCTAAGYPTNYNYISFVQTLNDEHIPNNHSPSLGQRLSSAIDIQSVKLQDTGLYTCSVNNGVQNIQGSMNQQATQLIRTKGMFVLLLFNMFLSSIKWNLNTRRGTVSLPYNLTY